MRDEPSFFALQSGRYGTLKAIFNLYTFEYKLYQNSIHIEKYLPINALGCFVLVEAGRKPGASWAQVCWVRED